MPLASSREASLKRAKKTAAEHKARRRLSLPSTTDSTSVEAKIKRRQSYRSQNAKENGGSSSNSVHCPRSPGPTPYWLVAQERGGKFSPPQTRSHSKKCRDLPPLPKHHNGTVLTFSPPNMAEIEKREKEEIARKESERAKRVAKAKANGQLLVFSPSQRENSSIGPADNENDDDHTWKTPEIEDLESPAGKELTIQRRSSETASNITEYQSVPSESKMMEQISGAVRREFDNYRHLSETELLTKTQTAYAEVFAKVEEANAQILSQQREKEAYLVEKTKLEAQLHATERESSLRSQTFEDLKSNLEKQIHILGTEKTELVVQVTKLQSEIQSLTEKIAKSKTNFVGLQKELDTRCREFEIEKEAFQVKLLEATAEMESSRKSNQELETNIVEYQKRIQLLELEVLPEMKRQLKSGETKISEKESEIQELQSAFDILDKELQQVRYSHHSMETTLQAERARFETMQKENIEKDELIDDLKEKLSSLKENSEQTSDMVDELENSRQALLAKVRELDDALDAAMAELDQSLLEKSALEDKISELVHEHHRSLDETKESLHMQEMQLNEMKQRNADLEKKLKIANQERDEARHNMQGFDEREEDLYQKLAESDRIRRQMHSRIMQLMGNIRVFVRIRPVIPTELDVQGGSSTKPSHLKRKHEQMEGNESLFRFPGFYDRDSKKRSGLGVEHDVTKNLVEMVEPHKDRGGLKDRRKKWTFSFDGVFSPEHGQDDVWEATEPLIQSAIDGYNVTVFAYGQTGSGKTYTMLGAPGQEGIISRAVEKIFIAKREIENLSRGEEKVTVAVELLEIYNEKVRDLLANNDGPEGQEVNLKVTSQEVVGNIVASTETKEEVLKILDLAQDRRCVKATAANAVSSRSHMLFTIHFIVKMNNGIMREGKLNICDLAGSERLSKSETHHSGGALLQETKNINKSLSVLSNVIERLQAGDTNVPFRESKLTFLLKNSLTGNSKTLAIVCCNPLPEHANESLCSLRFAEKVNRVDLKAEANFSC